MLSVSRPPSTGQTRGGKQLSDVDLLLAALVNRLSATLVSSDDDFDALPIKRKD